MGVHSGEARGRGTHRSVLQHVPHILQCTMTPTTYLAENMRVNKMPLNGTFHARAQMGWSAGYDRIVVPARNIHSITTTT